ncbi:MAG: carbamoyl-phosphate synthase large subunit [Oscillospiraceae bacterium]|jgi:carbamoyl-phosphate synthase large subunit|nr:carbamoyl-phosphate synthase large subunit [Oscillospiraceae bacterium]
MIDKSIRKVLVIGSGPIVIGQAAEFDYAGTQACRSLREEGVEVVLANSNPATIMTDGDIADKVYIEPLTVPTLTEIIRVEKPDSILPTLGGQTGLNLAMELEEKGVLAEYNVRLIGISAKAIRMAEDRQEFKDTMERIGEPCIDSLVVETVRDALDFGKKIGYPVIVRPAYTLGGTGGGIADTQEQLEEIAANGIRLSRVGQVLIEKCIAGWKEIEYEVMRDSKGNCITVCNMENLDPVGVHTGDSIVVAPSQTLTDKDYQMLRSSALNIISALGIQGGCNVQFALHPDSFKYAVIEVNPRVSRSSALASKATGYPIARVAAKIALGLGLDEIPNAVTGKTYASFEPALDYCVVKIPKWPFDKFVTAARTLGTQMKATGEVMAISRSFEAALHKALHSLEENRESLLVPEYVEKSVWELRELLRNVDNSRLYVVAAALYHGLSPREIFDITKIDHWFLHRIKNMVDMEKTLSTGYCSKEVLQKAKQMGFLDSVIARALHATPVAIKNLRKGWGILSAFSVVDTCAAEFRAKTPYYYSDYGVENEVSPKSEKKKVLVLGSGPIRIGQGIEFDYCSVHSVWALKKAGCEAIIINNNPETVSTDFDVADKLYFEPLTAEYVANIVDLEQPDGAIVQFGGQTAIKLTKSLNDLGVPILGTDADHVDAAEDRERFDKVLEDCGILRPKGQTVFTEAEAIVAANALGYPVLVRPSYVLGGQGMQIAVSDDDIREFMGIIRRMIPDLDEHPVLIDKYIMGQEVEVDAICDGTDILIPGIMEHIDRAGIHSGDSISVYPAVSLTQEVRDVIVEYTRRIAKALAVVGMMNIQFIVYEGTVYIIEVNPRSSRTVPYISKVTGIPAISLATRAMLGDKLADMGYGTGLRPESGYYAIKLPVFSFEKIIGADTALGPEMKSTGEALGIARNYNEALMKAFEGGGVSLPADGNILITVCDKDKEEVARMIQGLGKTQFTYYATPGTQKSLAAMGISCKTVNPISAESPNILDMLHAGKVALILNTPTHGRLAERDGFKLRRIASEAGAACLTSIDAAKVLLESAALLSGGKVTVTDIAFFAG